MKKNENCHNLLASLSDYIDGNLDENICTELERHLAECQNCRIVVDTMRKTIYLYQDNAERVEIPNDVRERLFQQLDLDEYLEK